MNKTPTCPGCGAKFSHDLAKNQCSKCGLPDEVADLGPKVIARWKRKAGIKRAIFGGSAGRRKNKHGRRGVKT